MTLAIVIVLGTAVLSVRSEKAVGRCWLETAFSLVVMYVL